MTFDHHTQLIRPARTSGRCLVRYQGLRNFHTCPAPGLECNSTETAATTTTATVCKQSPMESTSLHNQTWRGREVGKSVERLGVPCLGCPTFSISKKINKRLVRAAGPKCRKIRTSFAASKPLCMQNASNFRAKFIP